MSASVDQLTGTLRAELEPLAWPDRFERLAAVEKATEAADQRLAIAQLRTELAERAVQELSAEWGGIPLKEGVLRLPSKRMRAALGRAAKDARNRRVSAIVSGRCALLDDTTGFDERVLELPLALATARLDVPGRVLDAGAALNLPLIRQLVGRPEAHLTHLTLPGAKEPVLAGDEDRFTYVFGDLRALTYSDGHFDRIVCVSTLEHVGMDNTRFGAIAEHVDGSAPAAVAELVRVLAPGGELLITVPYGCEADHGWFRVFGNRSLAALLAPASSEACDLRFFYYDCGWRPGGPNPPSAVTEAGFMPDVITGIAVARIVKERVRP